MTELRVRRNEGDSLDVVSVVNPFPVTVEDLAFRQTFLGAPTMADLLWRISAAGQIFVASDADQNDTVLGQTSFVNTTPTFLLSVPAGAIAIPLFVNLDTTGTVAGGAIDVIIEASFLTNAYASGGTSEKIQGTRKGWHAPRCALWSGPTATAGYGVRLYATTMDQTIATTAAPPGFWKPEVPYILEGPASLNIFTYAATTGPTWFWSVGWAEIFDPAVGDLS